MSDFKTISQYSGTACFYCNSRITKNYLVCGRCSRFGLLLQQGMPIARLDPLPSAIKTFRLDQHPVITSFPAGNEEIKVVMDTLDRLLMQPVTKKLGPRAGKISTGLVFRAARCLKCLAINTNVNYSKVKPTFQKCPNCVTQWCSRDDCLPVEWIHEEEGTCATLSQIAQEEDLLSTARPYPPGAAPFLPPRILRVETPLPLDWPSYLKSIPLPDSINVEHQHVFTQHALSIPLTIVAALVKFGLFSKFSNAHDSRTLTIHIIGAEKDFELNYGLRVLEEITHLLPGVRNLVVVMVGPKLGTEDPESFAVSRCDECQRRRRTRRVDLRPTTYHNFLPSNPTSPPPDLAVAFSSGICEDPSSWKPTINLLLLNQAPTVFTSLNQLEGAADCEAIWKMGGKRVQLVWRAEESPFPSGRKHFDLFTPGWFWSENMYWFGSRGSS